MAELFSGMRDILFGYDTDIHFDNGDIMTTTGIDFLEREIYKLLITSPGDWRASPQIGASLESFIGRTNSREVGQEIESHLLASLSSTIYPAQLKVKVVPTGDSTLFCNIEIYVEDYVAARFPFEFNFVSGFKKVTLIDAKTTEKKSSKSYQINDISQTSQYNKYKDRLRNER